jgi:hypothetical protein
VDLGGRPQRRHSDIVHRPDGRADDRAAGRRRRKPQGDDHPHPSQRHGYYQRERGEVDVVGNRQPRFERQLGDKMRGPDTSAKNGGGCRDQSKAPPPGGFPRTDEEIDRGEAPANADEAG